MGEEAMLSLLESEGHGVLSMGAENRGYGLPMSYSYEREDDRLVLGFVDGTGSKKSRFASACEEVTLTVYTYDDVDSWKSVIVTGSLRSVDEADVSERFASLFFVAEDDTGDDDRMVQVGESDQEWYELRIDDITGRHSGT